MTALKDIKTEAEAKEHFEGLGYPPQSVEVRLARWVENNPSAAPPKKKEKKEEVVEEAHEE